MSFKIIFDKKSVLVNGSSKNFPTYQELKDKIESSSASPAFKKVFGRQIKNDDKFILIFDESSPVPSGLEKGIWNQETYEYFKQKASSKTNEKYRLCFNFIKEFPSFERKKPVEVLDENLIKTWKNLEENLKKELTFSILEKGKIEFDKLKSQIEKNENNLKEQQHENIICNCCKKNFKGIRFICAECKNYNLCLDCWKKYNETQIHSREHTLIRVNKPIKEENFLKYNNLFGNNNKIIQINKTSFKFNCFVINTGENKLKDCYLVPVRFGDEYLTCLPVKVKEEMKISDKCELNINISLPKKNRGLYEGYFRMFTPNGVPFGDLLKVKAVYED